jgi:hypothetical protein
MKLKNAIVAALGINKCKTTLNGAIKGGVDGVVKWKVGKSIFSIGFGPNPDLGFEVGGLMSGQLRYAAEKSFNSTAAWALQDPWCTIENHRVFRILIQGKTIALIGWSDGALVGSVRVDDTERMVALAEASDDLAVSCMLEDLRHWSFNNLRVLTGTSPVTLQEGSRTRFIQVLQVLNAMTKRSEESAGQTAVGHC